MTIYHSLKEFITYYDPDTIQLVCGDHIVNISTQCKGSTFIIRAFSDKKFYLDRYTESCKHLILNLTIK